MSKQSDYTEFDTCNAEPVPGYSEYDPETSRASDPTKRRVTVSTKNQVVPTSFYVMHEDATNTDSLKQELRKVFQANNGQLSVHGRWPKTEEKICAFFTLHPQTFTIERSCHLGDCYTVSSISKFRNPSGLRNYAGACCTESATLDILVQPKLAREWNSKLKQIELSNLYSTGEVSETSQLHGPCFLNVLATDGYLKDMSKHTLLSCTEPGRWEAKDIDFGKVTCTISDDTLGACTGQLLLKCDLSIRSCGYQDEKRSITPVSLPARSADEDSPASSSADPLGPSKPKAKLFGRVRHDKSSDPSSRR